MKISIYRVGELPIETMEREFGSIDEFLKSLNYIEHMVSGDEFNLDYNFSIWTQSSTKMKLKWQLEIENIVNKGNEERVTDTNFNESTNFLSFFSDLGMKYNCVLVIPTIGKGNVGNKFAIPFGNAYNDIEKICDPNFGIDVASRVFDYKTISITNVNKYFQSTLRQMTNYKKNTIVESKSSESVDALVGSPIEKYIRLLGKNISCSKSVSITKYDLEDYLIKMVPFFDNYLNLDVSISLPKVKKLSKADKITARLNSKLVEKIKGDSKPLLSLVGYRMVNSDIVFIESEVTKIYVKNKSTELFVNMDQYNDNITKIVDFIIADESGTLLQDYMVSVNAEEKVANYKLIDVIQTEVEYKGLTYVLTDGFWCEFNHSYLENLDKYISDMEIELNTNNQHYSGQLKILPAKLKITELDYINLFKSIPNYKVAHRQMVRPYKNGAPFGNGIELCDIIHTASPKKLVSIKKGLSTTTSAYSIDQSLLSLIVLSNSKDFKMGSLNQYIDAKIIGIQWILPIDSEGTPYENKTHTENVINNTFKLTDFRSIILKNKLMEWHSRVLEINLRPIIYLDVPQETT